jgi:hypothetical protein
MPATKHKRKVGRPPLYDRKKIVRALCIRVAQGELVKDVAADLGAPVDQLYQWVMDKEFAKDYAQARVSQAHAMAEEAISMADGVAEGAADRLKVMAAEAAAIDTGDKERDSYLKDQILRSMQSVAVQRDRLGVDTRKWLVSKIAPKIYGEKLDLTSDGKGLSALLALPPETPV